MPRKLSTIAPDWWDYTTLDNEIINDAAKLTPTLDTSTPTDAATALSIAADHVVGGAVAAAVPGSCSTASALEGEKQRSAASRQGSHCQDRCSRGASVGVNADGSCDRGFSQQLLQLLLIRP